MLIKLPSDYNNNHGCPDVWINVPGSVQSGHRWKNNQQVGDHHYNRMMAHVSDHLIQFKIKKIAQYKHVSLVARFRFRLLRFQVQIRDSPTFNSLVRGSLVQFSVARILPWTKTILDSIYQVFIDRSVRDRIYFPFGPKVLCSRSVDTWLQ